MKENEIGRIIVDSAVKLHKDLGPGLMVAWIDIFVIFVSSVTLVREKGE